jgi:cell division protein FtsI (penicillin-binding protein 3)
MSDSLHQRIEEIDAGRGTIYSEDGQMLSTSLPTFDIYIDFMADGLREKNGKRFKENIDSFSKAWQIISMIRLRLPIKQNYKTHIKRKIATSR